MNVVDVIPEEVEQERLKQIAELTDSDENWPDGYKPGSFGCHELLDRTSRLAEIIEQQIQTHPSCVANAKWFALAHQAAAALHELYQQVGAEHLAPDTADGGNGR